MVLQEQNQYNGARDSEYECQESKTGIPYFFVFQHVPFTDSNILGVVVAGKEILL